MVSAIISDQESTIEELEEYIAGTNPNNAADCFTQTVQPGTPLTVSVPGVAGRTYILWRSQSLTDSWTAVLTNGPAAANGPLLLADPAPEVRIDTTIKFQDGKVSRIRTTLLVRRLELGKAA